MVRLSIVVVPRASRTEIVGTLGEAFKIRLAAPPVDGAANEELIKFLGKQFGIPKNNITIISGATGKRKLLEIEGVSDGDIENLKKRFSGD